MQCIPLQGLNWLFRSGSFKCTGVSQLNEFRNEVVQGTTGK